VYRDQQGGDALWSETQTVAIDADGRYSMLLGSTSSDGLPLDLFTAAEPRWIGLTFQRAGEAEQPRVTVASVAYAIKAADADTLGGRPASAYRLADPTTASGSPATATESAAATNTEVMPVTAGTPGYLGVFTDGSSLGNSTLYQSGSFLGLGTTTPLDAFHVRFTDAIGAITGYAVQNLSATGYSGMLFYDQAGALAQFQGFGNTTHEYRINNIASAGTINFLIGSSSKFLVANSGNVGIGVPAPNWKLDVAGDGNFTGSVHIRNITALRIPAADDFSISIGRDALNHITPGSFNVAAGYRALFNNTGSSNTAVGAFSLQVNQASGNTAVGVGALETNHAGAGNTAVGYLALASNDSGASNTALGSAALINATGGNNIAIGFNAAQNVLAGGNNIEIGNTGLSADSALIRLGTPGTQTQFFTAGVRGVTTGADDAVAVVIDSNGQLGTISSSRRFKDDIQDMGDASRGLLRLRPVTFRYKNPFADGSKPIQYGLIAEEVAEVYPDLVAHSADGQIETVKYQVLDVLLLNEVQKQKAEIDDLRQRLARLEAALAARQ
jgi:hypothetical protein